MVSQHKTQSFLRKIENIQYMYPSKCIFSKPKPEVDVVKSGIFSEVRQGSQE